MHVEYNDSGYLKCSCNFFALFRFLDKKQKETDANIQSLQKAIAGLREQVEDFRAEQLEDNEEIKRQLNEVRRNKVWFPRERV
jgi:hypothetical protein